MRGLISMLLIITASAMAADEHRHIKFHPVPGSDGSLPFSDAVQVGRTLYLAGKLGNIAGTRELAEGGIQGQTRQTMQHIKDAVERYGSSMDQVVKCTVFLADMAEWGAMNEVYVSFFPNHKPARSAVGVNGLALDARVEIECIAALPMPQRKHRRMRARE